MLLAIGSFKPMFNLFCFIVVMTLGVAVTGRYVFGVRMNEITRSNFGSFFVAEITVFQLMIGDSWSGVVYAAIWFRQPGYPPRTFYASIQTFLCLYQMKRQDFARTCSLLFSLPSFWSKFSTTGFFTQKGLI